MRHWQAREITIEADPPQSVQMDGELAGQTPVTIRVVPGWVGILTAAERFDKNLVNGHSIRSIDEQIMKN